MGDLMKLAAVVGLASAACFAQSDGVPQPWTVTYVEGSALLNGGAVRVELGQRPRTRAGDVLSTGEGRAEVLMGVGSVLRIDEGSSVRMLSEPFADVRLELISGTAAIEVAAVSSADDVRISWRNIHVALLKPGAYRLDSSSALLRVFAGEALVTSEGRQKKVTRGRMLRLEGRWTEAKFDPKQGDAFDRWCARRASYLAIMTLYSERRSVSPINYWGWHPFYGFYRYAFYRPREVSKPDRPRQPRPAPSPQPNYWRTPPTQAGTSGTIAASSPVSTSAGGSSSVPVYRDAGNAGGARR